jgi:hypothetical protein
MDKVQQDDLHDALQKLEAEARRADWPLVLVGVAAAATLTLALARPARGATPPPQSTLPPLQVSLPARECPACGKEGCTCGCDPATGEGCTCAAGKSRYRRARDKARSGPVTRGYLEPLNPSCTSECYSVTPGLPAAPPPVPGGMPTWGAPAFCGPGGCGPMVGGFGGGFGGGGGFRGRFGGGGGCGRGG